MSDATVRRSQKVHRARRSERGGSLEPPVADGRQLLDLEPLPIAATEPLFASETRAPRRDSARRRSLAVADITGLCLAALVVVAFQSPGVDANYLALIVALPLWVLLNKLLRLYDRDAHLIHKSTLNELPSIAQSIALGTALVFVASPLLPGVDIGRGQTIVFWASATAMVPLLRWGARTFIRLAFPSERLVIVGSGEVAQLIARKIEAHGEFGASMVGYVDVDGTSSNGHANELLGTLDDFEVICKAHDIERVVVGFTAISDQRLLDVIRISKRLHLKVTIVPRLFEVIGHSVELDQIEGMTLLGLRGPVRTGSTLMIKRAIDIVGAGFGLIAVAPLLLVAAIAIKLDSPGPVFFRQRRIGRGNLPFTMFKFRTMVTGADELKDDLVHLNELRGSPMFKIANDPRVTRVGRILRRTSLDELPQLWNVVRGEMSLVGPRPLIPFENDHVIGWHRARLDLTPGLTGPWQVMGRTSIPFDEMVKLDYLYVADWSLWNDIKLLVRTLPVVVGRRGH